MTNASDVPDLFDVHNGHQVKVLMVDDKPENLISLESLLDLGQDNVEYLKAASGEEALKIASKEELALVLLDVQMPGMNGYEVANFLRSNSKTRDIPIIFVTAIDQDTSNMVEGFEAGAVDFLFKPLHPVITRAKVKAFVQFYEQKKALEKAAQFAMDINKELEERVDDRTKALQKINADLDNFVYTASHDLKAPISNIEGLMLMLQKHLSSPEINLKQIAPITEMINQSIVRFKDTIKDLTEIAKVEQESTDSDKICFKNACEDVKFSIVSLIRDTDALIEEDFSEAPSVYFSRKNLRSIIYNLLSNAIRYRSPDRQPVISIRSYTRDQQIVLSVKDNGLGIKKEDQIKIFGMFKRLHSHIEGTGMGMAIVKRIVENNGGKIEIDSEPGVGSTFCVYFKSL